MGKIVIFLRIRWEMISHLGETLSCKRSRASDSPLGIQVAGMVTKPKLWVRKSKLSRIQFSDR